MNTILPQRRTTLLCIALLFVVFVVVFRYIFDPKLNLGGDNCDYYMLSTSIAQGEGYVSLLSPDKPPTASFPPGYPLLMAGVRAFTDSIVVQKILNGLFLFGASVLLFFFVRRNQLPQTLALAACVVVLLNYRVLEFATMMMSEMSYLFFSALALYLLHVFDKREAEGGRWWKNPWLYALILCAGYAFQIRAQGAALVVGVAVWLLAARRWRQAAAFCAGFYLTTLPWTIRNHAAGLGASRYLDQILSVNTWRPEEGYASLGEVFTRGVGTLKMLLVKAVPHTVTPYTQVDYNAPASFGEVVVAALLIALIVYGFWQFRRYFWFFMAYTAAVIGIICLWSAPSENRYIVTLVPILEVGLVVGVWRLVARGCEKLKMKKAMSPLWLLIPAVLLAAAPLKQLATRSDTPYPPAYVNYLKIAQMVREQLPPQTVVCSRKPSLFHAYSHGCATNYIYTQDDRELIRGLLDANAEYVVLEQLGYASTPRYLYPAITQNGELFTAVAHLENPDTYLLKFDREAAAKKVLGE